MKKLVSKDTRNLLMALLVPNFEERYDIDSVLQHPAILNNMNHFTNPLSKREYDILLTNYYHSEYKVDTEYLK